MTDSQFDLIRENALIALTYIESGLNPDRKQAEADKELVLQVYGMDRMYKGSFLLLSVLLHTEATLLDIEVSERIAQIRAKVQAGQMSWGEE